MRKGTAIYRIAGRIVWTNVKRTARGIEWWVHGRWELMPLVAHGRISWERDIDNVNENNPDGLRSAGVCLNHSTTNHDHYLVTWEDKVTHVYHHSDQSLTVFKPGGILKINDGVRTVVRQTPGEIL